MVVSSSDRQQIVMSPVFESSGRNVGDRPEAPVVMSVRGLQFRPRLSFNVWLSIGRQLSELCSSSAWCLGDWLIYGEASYTGRYRDAIEQTSLDYQTLRNYAWVAKKFLHSRRRDMLSFGHHAEVAALPEPEQDFWLRKAEELAWSVKQLRREVRASLKERLAGDHCQLKNSPDKPHDELPMLRLNLHLSSNQLETCRVEACRMGLSMEEWVVLALEQAVRYGLDNGADKPLTARTAAAGVGTGRKSSSQGQVHQ